MKRNTQLGCGDGLLCKLVTPSFGYILTFCITSISFIGWCHVLLIFDSFSNIIKSLLFTILGEFTLKFSKILRHMLTKNLLVLIRILGVTILNVKAIKFIVNWELNCFLFWYLKTFLSSFSFMAIWVEGTKISHISARLPIYISHIYARLHTCIASIMVNICHQSGTFVTTSELILTRHSHPKSRVYITVHCSVVHFTGLKKCKITCYIHPMDRSAWQATAYRVTKSWIWLKRLSTHIPTQYHTK